MDNFKKFLQIPEKKPKILANIQKLTDTEPSGLHIEHCITKK